MEEIKSNKESYKEKKAQKDKMKNSAKGSQKRKQHGKAIKGWIIFLIIVGVIGFFFTRAVQQELPEGEDPSQFFESQGSEHISDGASHEPYSSNPPSSGSHYATPAPVGFYSNAVEDERIIHNLEHGDIWIAYKPGISDDVITALRAFENDGKVIITPREANDFDVSIVAWERVDHISIENNTIDIERIADFIKRHRSRGPERVNQPSVDGSAPTQSISPHGQ